MLIDAGRWNAGPGNEQELDSLLRDEIAGGAEEPMVAFRNGVRYVARLVHPAQREHQPQRLQIGTSGRLEDLRLEPATRKHPEPHEIEIRVRASGLNFRDVLTALGMLPARAATPGPSAPEPSRVLAPRLRDGSPAMMFSPLRPRVCKPSSTCLRSLSPANLLA